MWIFEYKRVQSSGGALFEGGFGDLFMLERPRWSATSIKLHGDFVGVALRLECSPVNLVVLFGRVLMIAPLEGCFSIYIYLYIFPQHI